MPDSNHDTTQQAEGSQDPAGAGIPVRESIVAPAAGRQTFPLRVVFCGPNGLRAGWRLSLFILIAVAFNSVLASLIQVFAPGLRGGARTAPVGMLLGHGLHVLAVLLAAAVMARIEKRSLADYAFPLKGAFGLRFWRGGFWGFAALTLLLLMIRLAHGFDLGSVALSGTGLLFYAAIWAITFLGVGLFEEFLYRGYALYTLTTGMGFWPSAVLLSSLFGAVHLGNRGESWVGAVMAGLIGLFFCFTVRRTGSLWFAIGLHAAWDYSESFIYSVPDSGAMVRGHLLNSSFHGPHWLTGGSAGPEASCFVFVVIGALFFIFHRLYPDVRFPVARPS